ncbi:MAG TPA: PilZ domain-containing protein [Thermoanaerobaculia bacterium]|nr:PilZ domain-containing protein [Thermoanaerobaculia bacterium]
MTPASNRRHFQRLHFAEPLVGQFGPIEVEIIDLSLDGARLIDLQPVAIGRRADLRFRWLDREVSIDSEVVRCKFERKAERGAGNIYGCGLRYVDPGGQGVGALREIISAQVMRALEEQIANAKGTFIPMAERITLFRSVDVLTLRPPAPQTHRISARRSFTSCLLGDRGWRTVATADPAQPPEGFTVSDLEDPKHVDLLCRTYQRADGQTRRMIRMLAELSVMAEAD